MACSRSFTSLSLPGKNWFFSNEKSERSKKRIRAYQNLEKNIKADESSISLEQISYFYRTYLGDKFQVDGLALTSGDVQRLLKTYPIEATTLDQIQNVLSQLESVQFSQNKSNPEIKTKILRTILETAKEIERTVKK